MNKKRILAFSLLHLVITLGCLLFSFGAGMDRFDNPRDPTLIENTIGYVAQVLMSPLYWLWTSWASKNIHNGIEWLLFVLNSGLWGLLIEYFYSKFRLRKNH